ncbi:MAG: tetratricopeptide repeat protein [Candidatus Heimdallarchaeota archaeon]
MPGKEGEISDRLRSAKQLLDQSRFEEALQIVNRFVTLEDLESTDQLAAKILKSQILSTKGDTPNALQLAEAAIKESKDLANSLQEVDACTAKAMALCQMGRFDESLNAIDHAENILKILTAESSVVLDPKKAVLIYYKGRNWTWKGATDEGLEHLQHSLKLHENIGNKSMIALSLKDIGIAYYYKGDRKRALKYTQQSLGLSEEIDNKSVMMSALNNMAIVYNEVGELNRALECYQQNLALSEEIDYTYGIAVTLANIGVILVSKGDLTRAMEHQQRALAIWEAIDRKDEIAATLNNIAEIHYRKGDIDQSMECDEKSLALYEEVGNPIQISGALNSLITKSTDIGALEQAQNYLERLKRIRDQQKNNVIDLNYRSAEAEVLKVGSRMADKVKAQQAFQELAEEENTFLNKVAAMYNLCELLLDEFNAYGEPAVFQEANILVEKIATLTQQSHHFLLGVNTLILRAKFAMVEGNLTTATELLGEAIMISKSKGLGTLVEKATKEQQRLEDQYDKWQHLIQSNAPFQARLKQARVDKYLAEALKLARTVRVSP